MPTQKLYAYVDESGQDAPAAFFVVVTVASDGDQHALRQGLIRIEAVSQTGHRKWHKNRPARRLGYLREALRLKLGHGEVFTGSYPKPIPYFFPLLDVLEYAIRKKARGAYSTRVFVDGIDHKKAMELTNALRARGISLDRVRSRRDESEPLIRLADMWAGCIRAAQLGRQDELRLLNQARNDGYLEELPKQKTP